MDEIEHKLETLKGTGLNPLRVSEWLYNAELRNIMTFKRLLRRGDEMLTVSMSRTGDPQIDMLVLDRDANMYVLEIKKKVTSPGQVFDILLQTLVYTAGILDWKYKQLNEEFQRYWESQPFEPKNLKIGVRYVHKEFFNHDEVFNKARFQKTPRILLVFEEMDTSRVTEAVNIFKGCETYEHFEERCLPWVTKNCNHRKKVDDVQSHWEKLQKVEFFYSVFMPRVIAEALTKPQRIAPFDLSK